MIFIHHGKQQQQQQQPHHDLEREQQTLGSPPHAPTAARPHPEFQRSHDFAPGVHSNHATPDADAASVASACEPCVRIYPSHVAAAAAGARFHPYLSHNAAAAAGAAAAAAAAAAASSPSPVFPIHSVPSIPFDAASVSDRERDRDGSSSCMSLVPYGVHRSSLSPASTSNCHQCKVKKRSDLVLHCTAVQHITVRRTNTLWFGDHYHAHRQALALSTGCSSWRPPAHFCRLLLPFPLSLCTVGCFSCVQKKKCCRKYCSTCLMRHYNIQHNQVDRSTYGQTDRQTDMRRRLRLRQETSARYGRDVPALCGCSLC
jgi:hypothetical protein